MRIRLTIHRDFTLSLPSFSSHALRQENRDTISEISWDILNPPRVQQVCALLSLIGIVCSLFQKKLSVGQLRSSGGIQEISEIVSRFSYLRAWELKEGRERVKSRCVVTLILNPELSLLSLQFTHVCHENWEPLLLYNLVNIITSFNLSRP